MAKDDNYSFFSVDKFAFCEYTINIREGFCQNNGGIFIKNLLDFTGFNIYNQRAR